MDNDTTTAAGGANGAIVCRLLSLSLSLSLSLLLALASSGCAATSSGPLELSPSPHRGEFRDRVTLAEPDELRVEHGFGIDEVRLTVANGSEFPSVVRVVFVGFDRLEGFEARVDGPGAVGRDLPVERHRNLRVEVDLAGVEAGAVVSLLWVDAYRM